MIVGCVNVTIKANWDKTKLKCDVTFTFWYNYLLLLRICSSPSKSWVGSVEFTPLSVLYMHKACIPSGLCFELIKPLRWLSLRI